MSEGVAWIHQYCVTNGEKTYEGTKEEIVSQIFTFTEPLTTGNPITVKVAGFNEAHFNSYGDEWSADERWIDAVRVLFGRLGEFKFRVYREVK